jgi:hypothetical protein
MSRTRGGWSAKPQYAVSYQDPAVFVPGINPLSTPDETLPAMIAGAALAGFTIQTLPLFNGLQPMTAALLLGALL